MILREYQTRAISDLRAEYARGRRSPCLVMPTGSGKTRVASEIMRLALAKSQRCLFLARRVELLEQCARTLSDYGIDAAVVQADRAHDSSARVVVASIPTLVTEGWTHKLPEADLVIWDECHGVKARTSLELRSRYSTSFHLGLTATPARGDGSPLGDVFDALVVGSTVTELTALEHLVPSRVYAPPQILNPRELALEPVEAYAKHCAGRRTLVFCTTVEHARRTAESFVSSGVRAEYVAGELAERPEILARYSRGEIDVLVNVNLLVEGYDDPPTSAVIFARRFTHAGPYLQACGRALRTSPGKTDAVIVDLCGSSLVHGTPDAERTYSLDGKAIRINDRESIRQCASCGGVFVARPACPFCGMAAPVAERSLPTSNGAGVSELAPKQKPTSWPMRAKKRSLCSSCGKAISTGDWIIYSASKRTAQHTSCASRAERSAA